MGDPNSMFNMPVTQPIELVQAKAAVQDVLAAFDLPENQEKLAAAKTAAAGDMMKMMMLVLPCVTEIQASVVSRYGYTPDSQGVMNFTVAVKQHEATDPEIKAASDLIKAKLLA